MPTKCSLSLNILLIRSNGLKTKNKSILFYQAEDICKKKVYRFSRLPSLNLWDFVGIRGADISGTLDMQNDWN